MDRATRERRTPRRVFAILATIGLVAGMFAVMAPGAGASTSSTKTCWAKNRTSHLNYGPDAGAALTKAINAAASGSRIDVSGRCVGNFSIDGKNLTLVGVAKTGYPVATLDGNLNGTVLVVGLNSAATVTLNNLTVTRGKITDIDSYGGGGIFVGGAGNLTVTGSTVLGNSAPYGGGVANFGTLTITNSIVSNNSADQGGAIENWAGSVTLNGTTELKNNTATAYGGGIDSYPGTSVTLSGTASVHGNSTFNAGGGISVAGTCGMVATLTGVTGVTVHDNILDNISQDAGLADPTTTITLSSTASVYENTAGNGGGIFNSTLC